MCACVCVCVCLCLCLCLCVCVCAPMHLCASHIYHKWHHEWQLHDHCLDAQGQQRRTHTHTHRQTQIHTTLLKVLSVLSLQDLVYNSLTSDRQGCGVNHSLWTGMSQRAPPTVLLTCPLTHLHTHTHTNTHRLCPHKMYSVPNWGNLINALEPNTHLMMMPKHICHLLNALCSLHVHSLISRR